MNTTTATTPTNTYEDQIAQYRNHCVVYPDGSPAGVPVGQSISQIPQPYIDFATQHFRAHQAKAHWEESIQWRTEQYDILTRPNQRLREMEQLQPMYIHGVSKDGRIVLYEPMRYADIDGMFQNGLVVKDHVERAVYLTEFMRHELYNGNGRYLSTPTDFSVIYVKDMQDLDITKYFASDAFQSRTDFFDLARKHYPGMFQHALCLHLPRWMAGIARRFLQKVLWGFVTPEVLCTEERVLERLSDLIGLSDIPVAYGGTSPYELGEHPLHRRYVEFTEQYLSQNLKTSNESCTVTSVSPEPALATNCTVAATPKAVEAVVSTAETDASCSEESFTEPVKQRQQDPFTAVVSTVWLGVWSFLSSFRSLLMTSGSALEASSPSSAIMNGTAETTTTTISIDAIPAAPTTILVNDESTRFSNATKIPKTKKRRSMRRWFRKGRSFETLDTAVSA